MTEETVTAEVASPDSGISLMGWALVVGGTIGALFAFFYNVGVDVPPSDYMPASQVANIDMIAVREMILSCSLAAFVAGCVLIGAAHVAKAARR